MPKKLLTFLAVACLAAYAGFGTLRAYAARESFGDAVWERMKDLKQTPPEGFVPVVVQIGAAHGYEVRPEDVQITNVPIQGNPLLEPFHKADFKSRSARFHLEARYRTSVLGVPLDMAFAREREVLLILYHPRDEEALKMEGRLPEPPR
ncbi:MAG: hypothetical protein HYV63_24255 [Candidatus Schekmanbacteria bacterium]|nr:hypothetical protein [Candidatus Schekmanbacteria bacterium]